jgi:5'-nucleotidase
MMPKNMSYHILITNDDGIHSPALRALEVALSHLGRVTVVAPDRERSATSHCITLDEPVAYSQVAPSRYAVQGTPADCVIVALFRILPERPSIVISGVNQGLNVGEDILYSGTVAAASEAAIQGLPAIAVSASARENADYTPAASIAARLAERILKEGLPPDVILNVNCPGSWNREFRLTRQGRRSRSQTDSDVMSDIEALASGYVSITPLHINRTFSVDASSWLCDLALGEEGATKGTKDI